jgi:hypothetical protein
LIYIISPARDKGQVFLKRDNNMWNWMPAIGRMIKIPPSMMMSGWMGSDFNNDELMKENSLEVDYSHQFLPEETIDGIPCYQIELTPLPSAPVVWGKVILWISKDKYFGLKSHFYDDDGKLINIQTASRSDCESFRRKFLSETFGWDYAHQRHKPLFYSTNLLWGG